MTVRLEKWRENNPDKPVGKLYTEHGLAYSRRHLKFFPTLHEHVVYPVGTRPPGIWFGLELEWDFKRRETQINYIAAWVDLCESLGIGAVGGDGSLGSYGTEVRLYPMRYEAVEQLLEIAPLPTAEDLLSKHAQGMHVNINTSYFPRRAQILRFKQYIMQNEDKVTKLARRPSGEYYRYGEAWDGTESDNSKYHAVNTAGRTTNNAHGRIEVRVFKTPTQACHVLSALRLVKTLADYAKQDNAPRGWPIEEGVLLNA